MVSTTVYCTAAEIRDEMSGSSTGDDTKLLAIATAASRVFDGYMGYRHVGFVALSTATAKEYSSDDERYLWIDACTEITAVAAKDSVTDATYDVDFTVGTHVRGFRGDPRSKFINFNETPYHGILILPNAPRSHFINGRYASERGFPIHPDDRVGRTFFPTVQVTAKWGAFTTVPEIIKRATIMQSLRWYKRGEGAMADAVLSGDFNIQRYSKVIDPDIKMLLDMSGLRAKNPLGGR